MIRFERRASTVLFNLLRAHPMEGPVLVPENVCGVVLLVLKKLGREVELLDLSLSELGIDDTKLLERWSDPSRRRPAALIYVRPYGNVADRSGIFAELRRLQPQSLIIDDRCLAFPDADVMVSESVDAVLYSTGYAKCAELGFGGFAVTASACRYGSTSGFYDTMADKYWMDAVKLAVTSESMLHYDDSDWLDTRAPGSWTEYATLMHQECLVSHEVKERVNAVYREGLPCDIQIDKRFNDWRFNIWVESSVEVLTELTSHGLFASAHYKSIAPVIGQTSSTTCQFISSHLINLFNYRYVDVRMAEETVAVLTRKGARLAPGPGLDVVPVGGYYV